MTLASQATGNAQPAALAGIRVLDLSAARNQYCGKLFADMGADVILVEPPGGSGRDIGPYFDEVANDDASIPFFYNNTGKRSVVCDLDSDAGRALLRKLAASADLIIETEQPGAMVQRGLGYEHLRALRSSLVYLSITPFGQSGPYADYAADDLTLLALGGMLHMGGYADGAPQAMYGEQAYNAGSLFAAVAALTAIIAAERTGKGEYIDVSIHESIVMGLENAAQFYDLERIVRPRAGGHGGVGGQLPCKDGYVYLMAGGVSGRKAWTNTVDWLIAEGVKDAASLKEPHWFEGEYRATRAAKEAFLKVFLPFSMQHTKQELYEAGKKARIPLAPVATPKDVLANRQLQFRKYFVDVWSESAQRQIKIPGAPYQHSLTPWRVTHPAPRLGQHTEELIKELQ